MDNIFDSLNEQQKEAVFHENGPLLIIAGAGTGKTKVITSRIMHFLLNKKVPTGNILALTFTEKAAEEMAERVDTMLPYSYGEIAIKTFHGFCNSLLREKGLEIGIDPGFKLLGQTEQWFFLKQNIFNIELDYYRPLGNPSKFFFTLLNHFSRLKDEDILPEKYVKYAEELMSKAVDETEKENAAKCLEVAHAYEQYQKLMIEQNSLDYGDLQFYALRLLEKRPSVLEYFRNKYQYILVDEFQDTNFAQYKLVSLLANKHRNLTVVGDDDQSIYKWRGASLANINSFERDYPESKKVVLTQNYRSTQPILDASYSMIQANNPDRLEFKAKIDKRLKAVISEGHAVEVRHFANYQNEAKRIATDILDLAKQGVSYRDMAILVRTNQIASPFINALEEAEIPFSVRDTQGLTRFAEIKDLLGLLHFLTHPHDDRAVIRILAMDIFSISMREILDLKVKAKAAEYKPIFYYLRDEFDKNKQEGLPGIDNEKSDFFRIFELLNNLLDFSKSHSVTRTIGEFLDKTGLYKVLMEEETLENHEKLVHIGQFLDVARAFEEQENSHSVEAFSEYIELLEEAQGFVPSISFADEDAVSVLTIHSAKGLEFDTVFLPSMCAQRFPSTEKKDPIEVPDFLISESLPGGDVHLQEERRLFYVACTRAKNRLYISYSDRYEGNKKWKPSAFLAELSDVTKIEMPETHVNEVLPISHEVRGKMAYSPEVKVSKLSYSKVSDFETCPLKYKFRYIYEIKPPEVHRTNFGTSIHDTVHEFYVQIKDGKAPSLDLLKECYEKKWLSTGYESKAHMTARKNKGWEVMENFYKNEETRGFKIPVFLEQNFTLKINNIVFIGRIDRIDKLDDGTYEVVDYKTGTYKKGENIKKDLQLSIYALACRDVFKIPVSKLSLYFIEDGNKVSTSRTDEDLEKIKETIDELLKGILSSDFNPVPGFHCGYCDYKILCNAATT